jgi:hypothetical protein
LNVANPIALWASATDLANLTVTIWAGIWIALAGVFAYRARHGDGLRAAGWMIAIAAFLAAQEDPGLLVYMASIAPGVDRDGVLGLVHPHTRGHMYGGAILAVGGLVVCAWIAFSALRHGERWAWAALLVYLSLGASVDIVEILFIYPHGFPLGVTPPDGVRGFGWEAIAAWILIWAFALWFCRPHLRRSFGGSPETTRVRGGEQ